MKVVYCLKCRSMLQIEKETTRICYCGATLCTLDSYAKPKPQVAIHGPCRVVLFSDEDWDKLRDGNVHNVRVRAIKEPHPMIRRKDDRQDQTFWPMKNSLERDTHIKKGTKKGE